MSDRVRITEDISHHRTDRVEHIFLYDQHCVDEVLRIDPTFEEPLNEFTRSYYDKELNMNGISQYYRSVNELDDIQCPEKQRMIEAYAQATEIVKAEFSTIPKVTSLDARTEIDQVKFDSATAAGYGYIGKKGLHRGENHMKAIAIVRRMIGDLKDGITTEADVVKNAPPYIAHTRTQLVRFVDKLKVRPVWGITFHMLLAGALSSQPWTDRFIELDDFYTIGDDPRTEVPKLISRMHEHFAFMETGDWANQDASTKEYEIRAAFEIFERRTIFPNIESLLAFEISRETFICKRIVDPYQRIVIVNTGIPSGHPWTQLIGTMCSRLRKITLLLLTMPQTIIVKTVDELNHIRSTQPSANCVMLVGQGDDDLAGTDNKFPIDAMNVYANEFDWPFNTAKVVSSRDVFDIFYLQRSVRGTDHIRDRFRCVLLLCLPELPQVEPIISAFRAQALYEDQGMTSDILEKVARILREKYAPEGFAGVEIPRMHKEYIPGMGHVRRFVV
jgi:hypothetical protein